ncbi:HDOD domain-containing protein [Ectothiorhodospiraceae bacterium WFHF3C12]|nr:HDOD domain-containing protein [Ectothiorhodospiraceae bacterium WFHF3C12]
MLSLEEGYTLEDLFHETVDLPAFPPVLTQLQQLLSRPSTTMEDVARLVETEPALAARVLRLVNSPLYRSRAGGELTDLYRAVTLVGTGEIQTLATASFAVSAFATMPGNVVDMQRFWRHSVYTGLLAAVLGRLGWVSFQGNLFVAGLLHDIGALLIYQRLPEWAAQCIAESERSELPLDAVERDIIGFDHAMAGAALLRHWDLPQPLVAAAEHHHRDPAQPPVPPVAAVVRLANAMADSLSDAAAAGYPAAATARMWEAACLDSGLATEALAQADDRLEGVETVLLG